jgi:hypothetical protein
MPSHYGKSTKDIATKKMVDSGSNKKSTKGSRSLGIMDKDLTKKTKKIGSRAEVFHGNAQQTSGGLEKKDLMKKDGRIVSKKTNR